jgi:hypothetical protein
VSPQDSDRFAADLAAGLADVGTASVADNGIVSFISPKDADGETRSFTFVDSVDEIRDGITVDDDAWQSMWPGWTLEKAAIAMFPSTLRKLSRPRQSPRRP